MRHRSERGAVALEFALLLPILLLLLLGIVEFGRAYNAQITLTQAAREAVRVMAIEDDAALAESSTIQAAASLDPALMTVQIESRDPSASGPVTEDKCSPGHQVTVRIAYKLKTLTGFFGPLNLTGQGAMRCGG
jgi:Flp pilus assembly protein TadG